MSRAPQPPALSKLQASAVKLHLDAWRVSAPRCWHVLKPYHLPIATPQIWSILNQPNNRIHPDCCRHPKSAYLGDIEVWFPACFLHDDVLLHNPNLAATHEQFIFSTNPFEHIVYLATATPTSTHNAFEWRAYTHWTHCGYSSSH